MEGPVFALGLLAALVVCGKTGHHPTHPGPHSIPLLPFLQGAPHPPDAGPSPSPARPPGGLTTPGSG